MPAMSPIPAAQLKAKKEMSFPDAIKEVINGEKITKLEWGNTEVYGFLDKGILSLHKDDGKIYKWIVSEGDLVGTDWEILPA